MVTLILQVLSLKLSSSDEEDKDENQRDHDVVISVPRSYDHRMYPRIVRQMAFIGRDGAGLAALLIFCSLQV